MSVAVVQVADMLLELCVTELEDVATDSQSGRLSSQPVVVESSHPYTDDTSTSGTVKIPGMNTLEHRDAPLLRRTLTVNNIKTLSGFGSNIVASKQQVL